MSKLKKRIDGEEYTELSDEVKQFYAKTGEAFILQTDDEEIVFVKDLEINNPEIILEAPDKEGGQREVVSIASLMSIFHGPLPPPEQLKQYNDAFPDAAQKIFELTEGEAKHRRKLEGWETKGDVIRSFAGLLAALGISLFIIYIAWDLALKGYQAVAAIIAVADVTALVTVFIYGTRRHRENDTLDRKSKEKDIDSD